MLSPALVTAPAVQPVSIDEAKVHLRVTPDVTEDDALIEGLIKAATGHLDGWVGILGRCLVNQEWRSSFCGWPACRTLRLPFPDVSAAAVAYFDEDNVEQSVSDGLVSILHDARSSVVRLSDDFAMPSLYGDRADAVRVTFTAGYGAAADDVPAPIRAAILLLVSHWFHNREAAGDSALSELPLGVSALVAPYRRVGL
jgi:uncharacterized phiE125 gp8 family phage protein